MKKPNLYTNTLIKIKTVRKYNSFYFDKGEELAEKLSSFDHFIQIIDGTAEVMISGKNHRLTIEQGIITPTSHILEHFVILCKIERVK